MKDQQLQELITEAQTQKVEVSQHTQGSPEWTKATKRLRKVLNLLLCEIPKLPGLTKCNHPEYPELLDDILIEVANRIHEFQPKHNSITSSLEAWINFKLRLAYRVKELCSHDSQPPPLSLDQLLNDETNTTFVDILPDTKLSSPDSPETEFSIAYRLWEYILHDPERKLQNCIPQKYPNCNAQAVARMLYSGSYYKKNYLAKLNALAEEFGIPYKTFYSYWQKHCQPLLTEIAREIGNSLEKEL